LDEVDCVLNAMVGSAGLRASFTAIAAGKRLALANKESLVVGGDLLMKMAAPGQLIPVDSEHSAIFQCLAGERIEDVERLWLTASGGPFRGWSRKDLANVQASDALAHPTWRMGAKITIDSATMMNKGLELIEAMHLFGLPLDKISVIVHPQSIIHSMVEYRDGSIKAQLGVADMHTPIQYALSYPERWESKTQPLDFFTLRTLSFRAPDVKTFACLQLAIDAATTGGTAPAALNAANEEAVAAFLVGQIGFLNIEDCVRAVLEAHQAKEVQSVEQLESVDAEARYQAQLFIAGLQ
ncbi:MAG: 1-deoxy-D-xylulose-5-phosphate reductoisomerase, partial [Coriobacteriia bacterium]|nr:1-deoxy-D-xylulose-5-phosphate reductoisomerase [Coriobacteriia bacterium]